VFLRRDGNHLEGNTVRVQKTSSHFLRREMLNVKPLPADVTVDYRS
jgi:hypothetical protein